MLGSRPSTEETPDRVRPIGNLIYALVPLTVIALAGLVIPPVRAEAKTARREARRVVDDGRRHPYADELLTYARNRELHGEERRIVMDLHRRLREEATRNEGTISSASYARLKPFLPENR